MGIELDERQRTVPRRVRLQQRIGDEMIAAEREELRAAGDDRRGLRLDRSRRIPSAWREVERGVAVVDDRERRERVEAERILRIAVEDRRGAADRLRPEARARPVGRRLVERDAPDHRIDAGEVARVAPPHEGQRAAIGRLHGAALQRAEEGVVGGTVGLSIGRRRSCG